MKYSIGDLFTSGASIFYIYKIEYDPFRKMNYYHFTHLNNQVQSYLAECEIETAFKKQRVKHYPVKE
jgi:hypothetical protein